MFGEKASVFPVWLIHKSALIVKYCLSLITSFLVCTNDTIAGWYRMRVNYYQDIFTFTVRFNRVAKRIACMKLKSPFAKNFAFIFSAFVFNSLPRVKARNKSPGVCKKVNDFPLKSIVFFYHKIIFMIT